MVVACTIWGVLPFITPLDWYSLICYRTCYLVSISEVQTHF
jgi:uncharacterized membrane protein